MARSCGDFLTGWGTVSFSRRILLSELLVRNIKELVVFRGCCVCACVCEYACVCVCARAYVYVFVCVRARAYMCVCARLCVCVCVCVCGRA
jgi:hypothetical protein